MDEQRIVQVRLENISRSFVSRKTIFEAVNHVSIDVYKNEFLVLLGPGQCGKTVLLNMVSGLETPTEGKVEFVDSDKTDLGFVFQKTAVFPWKTVMENVEMPLELKGVPKKERRERAQYLIDLVGLHGFENALPKQLSGGMKQRVGIARAYCNNPQVLLMDEPFGALDPVTRGALQAEMSRIHRILGRTIVLVTHDIDEALRLADRLVLMDHGEVVQQGTPLELLTSPANDFVREFFGRSELGVRLLSLRTVRDYLRPQDAQIGGEPLHDGMSLRDALSAFVARQCEVLPVADGQGTPCGTIHFRDLLAGEVTREVGP